MAGTLVNAFDWTVKSIGRATDYISLFEAGIYAVESASKGAIAGIEREIASILDTVKHLNPEMEKLLEHEAGITERGLKLKAAQFDKESVAAATSMNEAMDAFHKGVNASKAEKWIDDFKASAIKAAQATGDLHNNLGPLGGGDPEESSKKIQHAAEESANAIKHLYEETRTPQEKFAEQLARINELFLTGQIGSDLYRRAMNKAQEDLDKTVAKLDKVKHFEVDALTH